LGTISSIQSCDTKQMGSFHRICGVTIIGLTYSVCLGW
jgi:hypothetical protein